MILNEKEKLFIQNVLRTEDDKTNFINIFDKKINELKDCSNFKTLVYEKDLTFNEIYSGRMAAMITMKGLAEELLSHSITLAEKEAADKNKHL